MDYSRAPRRLYIGAIVCGYWIIILNNFVQLKKEDFLALTEGMYYFYIKLFKINSLCPPICHMARCTMLVKEDLPPINQYSINKSALISVFGMTWTQYDVANDITDIGDLVHEDFLMRVFSTKKS